MQQGQSGQRLRLVGIGLVAAREIGLRVEFVNGRLAEEIVGQAGRVPEQILNGDGANRRREIEAAIAFDADLRAGESRNEFRDRIGEQNAPFLDHLHNCDRHDRLRHRIDAEDRIMRHHVVGQWRTAAEGLEITDASLARDQGDGARNPPGRDLALKHVSKPVKPFFGQADLARFGMFKFRHSSLSQTAL